MLRYLSEGEGAPIVLVPGGLTGCASWEPHAKRLAATRKVVRVQLMSVDLGLRNRALPPNYSLRTESEALKDTLDAAVPDGAADVAAWSYGAAIALDHALNDPGRMRSLTLIEPPAFWVLDALPQDPGFEQLRRLAYEVSEEVSEDQLAKFVRAVSISPPGAEPTMLPQWPTWSRYRQSLLNLSAPLDHHDDRERLKALSTPTLLVKGAGSAPFFHAIIDALGRLLPVSEIMELPAGHAPHIVSMDRFLDRLSRFHDRAARVAVTAGGW